MTGLFGFRHLFRVKGLADEPRIILHLNYWLLISGVENLMNAFGEIFQLPFNG